MDAFALAVGYGVMWIGALIVTGLLWVWAVDVWWRRVFRVLRAIKFFLDSKDPFK